MSHAVCAHNIQHVIVDNLQFMLGTANLTDAYSAQNQVIGTLRRFASSQDVHITIVMHPRKVCVYVYYMCDKLACLVNGLVNGPVNGLVNGLV